MTDEPTDDLVRRAAKGERDAVDRLVERLQKEIHKIANALLAGGRRDIQATEIVSLVWAKLIKQRDPKWKDRAHFLRFCARAARWAIADLPNPDRWTTLHPSREQANGHGEGVPFVDLERCLKRLETKGRSGPRIAEVVLLRSITDLTWDEIADVLDAAPRTVKGDWSFGRVFMQTCLGPP
jgi:DNA-directed RNA polymerase specialized sigma24 family protein